MVPHKFDSVAKLVDSDERGELDDETFDTELWLFLIERIESPQDRHKFDDAVIVYYASRLIEWDVGNGGFAQAAYNIPDWFELAAWSYDCLGLSKASALIREAIALLRVENRATTFTAEEIGELFEQFGESKLSLLDQRLDASGWWANEARLRCVRENRDAFRKIA